MLDQPAGDRVRWLSDQPEDTSGQFWRVCPACELPIRFIEVAYWVRKKSVPIGPMQPAKMKVMEFPYCTRHSRLRTWLVYDRRHGIVGRANVMRGGDLYVVGVKPGQHTDLWSNEKKRNMSARALVRNREQKERQMRFSFNEQEAAWVGREDVR